jgi:hypothetical protein
MVGQYVSGGTRVSFSQCSTVSGDTLSTAAACGWVMPRARLRAAKCSPSVVGCAGITLGFNDLSGTRTNGKKATRLCPCGYSGDPSGRCRCTADAVARYRGRISGPMLDRIDMHVEVPRVPPAQWREPGEDSATVRARVLQAREMQQSRAGKPNALLGTLELARDAALSQADRALLDSAAERLGLSARAHQRILRVSRSIADLAGSDSVHREHLTEAIGYRRLDRLPMAAVG